MLEPRGVLITRVYRSVNCRLITGWLVMFCALLMTATGALAQSGPPTLGFLLPNHGGPGESVTVTLVGTNFTSDMTVSVANLTITVTDVSFLTSETATATFLISDPAHGGARSVTVQTPQGESNPLTFDIVLGQATVSSVDPSVISAIAGPTLITITGTNFDVAAGQTTVSIWSNVSSISASVSDVNVVDSTQLTVLFTLFSTITDPTPCDVKVTTPQGIRPSNAGLLTIKPHPTIISISPLSGHQGSTLQLTVTGTGFDAGNTSVRIRGGSPSGFGNSATEGNEMSLTNVMVSSTTVLTGQLTIPESMPLGQYFTSISVPYGSVASSTTFTTFTVVPLPNVEGLEFSPPIVPAGLALTGKVTINPAAAITGGETVTLTSSHARVEVPTTITIPEGSTSARFLVTTSAGAGGTSDPLTASITATLGTSSVSESLSLLAADAVIRTDTQAFNLAPLGAASATTSDDSETPSTGYAVVEPNTGSVSPSGIAISGFRQGGVLISEASVPATAPVQEGRIFAEVNGPVNTGLAIVNPNNTAASIDFFFTDTDGVDFGSGSFELGANQQTAKFLDQDPFNGGTSVLGTFTFTSSVPVSVVALRGFTNEQSEFLMTTLPVAPLQETSSANLYFPHYADGSGWTTQVILVNSKDSRLTGTLEFLGQGSKAAAPVTITLDDGSVGSSFNYSIPSRSSQRFTTSNPSGAVSVGSVRAIPYLLNATPSGLLIFSFVSENVTVSEAGVPALPEGSAFRFYVEVSGTPGQIGSVRSGVAITDTSGASNTVTLELTNLDGSLALAAETLSIPPSGQVARFLDELFSLPKNFSGVLRLTSTSDIAVVDLRLRVNERAELKMTTTPPANEASVSTTANTYFPHLVDSAGWSTQFILFSGTAGQTSAGTLSFVGQDGQALDLFVN